MESESFPKNSGPADSRPRKALRILADAVKLTRKSWRPMILFMFIFLIYHCFYLFAYTATLTPASILISRTIRALGKPESSKGFFEAFVLGLVTDFRTLDKWILALFLLSFLFFSFLQTVAITALAMVSRDEEFDARGHLIMTWRKWKNTMVTGLYHALIVYSFFLYLLAFTAGVVFIFDFSAWSYILAAFIVLSGYLLMIYLDMLLRLGIVITAAEEGGYGLTAIGRASELIQGRKGVAIRLNLLRYLFVVIVAAPIGLLRAYWLILAVFGGLLTGLLAFYSIAVDVEFYNECILHAEGEGRAKSFGYSSLTISVPVPQDTKVGATQKSLK
ncbi:uncharacterized protein LOC144709853 [Wolffia australiana]